MNVGIDKLNVFSRWRKVDSDGTDVLSTCRIFQTRGPATGKTRVPIVDSLNGGTTRRLVPAERRNCRPGRLATRTTVPRYSGAIPCITLNVSTAILQTTRSGTRSQCKLTSASVTWSKRRSLQINRASAFCADWRRRTRNQVYRKTDQHAVSVYIYSKVK